MELGLIKQDINFLEFPLWFQNKDLTNKLEKGFVWEDLQGFIYKSAYKPPAKTDFIVLLALLSQSQKKNWNKELQLTRYELLKNCGFGTTQGTYWYKRLEESFERWMHVVVSFDNTFYDGKKQTKGQFHIIDDWELNKETKKLHISLSSKWLEHIKNSTYYKMLDFEQIKALRSPLATRLYELLIKTFQTRSTWSCGAKKLAAKIPMNEKYPSDIIPKIKTAVKRINERTELQIQLEVKRPERGKAIFYFEKTSVDEVPERKEAPKQLLVESKRAVPKKKEKSGAGEAKSRPANIDTLLALIPSEHREKKTIRDELVRQLRKNGFEYVRGNILYTNQNAKEKYRIYLNKALKNNWGEGYLEELQQAEEKRRRKRLEEERKRAEERKQQALEQKAHEQFQALTPQEREKLEEEAKAALKGTNPSLLQGSFASVAIKMQMKVILIKKIKEEADE